MGTLTWADCVKSESALEDKQRDRDDIIRNCEPLIIRIKPNGNIVPINNGLKETNFAADHNFVFLHRKFISQEETEIS